MSTTKLITGITAAVALFAIGTAVHESGQTRAATAAAESLRVERDDLRTQVSALQKRVGQSGADLAAQQKELDALRASASAAKPAVIAQDRAPTTQYGGTMDYVLLHPEAQPAFLEQQRLRMRARFARFFRSAGISAAQQETFLKETQDVAAAELDLMAAMRAQGWGVGNLPKDPEAQKQLQALFADQKKARETSANNIRAALGDAAYQQLQEYGSMAAERNVADQVAAQVYATDAPLTQQQADEITRILAQNRFTPQPAPSPTSSLGGVFVSPQMFSGRMGQAMQQGGMSLLDWSAPVTDAALEHAAAVLPPAQLAALRQIQAEQTLQFQLAPLPPGATGNGAAQPATGSTKNGG